MYRAKAAGGLSVVVAEGVQAALAVGADHRPPDRSRIQQALAAEQFVLHYQPIVDVHTLRLASVEALVRWEHPDRGLLPPGAFLGGIEEVGLSVELGTYVLRRACRQLVGWRAALGEDAPPKINVNVSVRQLLDPGLADTVLGVLSETGLAAAALRLKLPEMATTVHMKQAQQSLGILRSAGVGITLDDLGAGASSLRHLTQMTLDGIKIDRLAGDRPCYLQGYLVSRPVAASDLRLPWSPGTTVATLPTARRPAAPLGRPACC